ncbi:hypothetical protein AOH178_00540 [Helicobacter pylori]
MRKFYATIGHFTNLIGVDIENNFACKFEIKEDKAKKINFLINACRDKKVYIATDPDRELWYWLSILRKN